MHTKLLIAIGVLGLSLWFNMTGLAMPYWWGMDSPSIYVGLFKYCTTYDQTIRCTLTSAVSHTQWLQAVQTMLIAATLAQLTDIVLITYKICLQKEGTTFIYIAAGLALLGGLLSLIGIIVFSSLISQTYPSGHLMTCFGLIICSIVTSFIAFGIIVYSLTVDTY